MNRRTPVVDISGQNPETILQWAKDLGTDKVRRTLFDAVYGRGAKPRSKKQLMDAAGIAPVKAQQVQNQLDHLSSKHLIERLENDGSVKDGSRWLYQKDPTVRANRAEIVKFADNRQAAKNVVTKRQPAVRGINLPKPPSRQALRRRKHLNVLYLTANPDKENSLRLDEETARIQETIRGSVFRDKVSLQYRPAATLKSIIDGLNDFRPRIVHFSGHGNQSGIAVNNRFVSFDLLSQALRATDTPPDVVVLNSCKSADARRLLIPPSKVVIVMRDTIGDLAASLFAVHFYGAIAAGQSVRKAFEQGKLGIAAASLGTEVDTPDLLNAADVNPATMILT